YYLAITGFANQPLSEGPGGLQPIFEFDSPVEISGPDGPGGMDPIVGWSGGGETGAYLILLSGVTFLPCGEVPCPAGGLAEAEPCGGDENGGCNVVPPAFQPVPCGATICGTSQAGESGPGLRDTDWYQVELLGPGRIITRGLSQFPHGQGLIEYEPGFEGSGDCAHVTGFVNPVALGDPCLDSVVATDCLPAGTYFVFMSQQGFEDNLCGFGTNDYTLEVQCVPCAPCPADFDHSGDVGFTDLLSLLAVWGPCVKCVEDLDGDGDVGFVDLLTLLAAWGLCP
ncbi:MAG: hypothetical protein HKO59_13900, partial [Phycisphaerales bacterium]|nr:hypothetical protein [Phycisphaerales bacterium]